ncbi:hypothetical protein V1264_023998 [Littorina saxatilis]|uniref:Nucleoporin NDC1 n=1 Tax=Littorina saxatilis TaxID=31220 RepID=A0AAN9B935_9CAEN
MDSVVYWYKTEVYFWRSAGSLFWSITCLPLITIFLVILSQFSFLHPWQALADFASVVLSLSFLLWLGILTAILITIACTATFTVVPDVPATRLRSYLSLLRWSRWPHLIAAKLGGACVAWVCSHFMDQRFYSLTTVVVTTDRELLLLNESHLFLVLAGAMAGLVYYTNFYLSHLSYLAFPTLQRDKYFRARSEIIQLAKLCVRLTWRHIRLFYLGYWLLGGSYRSWVLNLLNVEGITEEQPLDTFFGLLDLTLLCQTCLCTFFILFTWSLTAVLYRVYHTQRLEIPVLTTFSSASKHCLSAALAAQTAPLLQHLAFLDLAYLSGHSPQRRVEVFSLSQPGGHPYTWRAVCSACLQQLEALAAQVQTAHLAALATLPVQHLPAEKIFSTTGVQSTPSPPPQPVAAKTSFTSKLYSGLKDKPILSYFLMELPDTKSRQLFAACQIHIWAIEAMSQLAAASYEEDKFGVVQQTLSAIFTSLISLQDTIEKYFKLQPLTVRRSSKESHPQPHITLCQQLRVTLKTAIYRLTNSFGRHLGDLNLNTDCMKRVRPFLDYRE